MTKPQPVHASGASRRRAQLRWGVSLAALLTAAGAPAVRAQSVGALMAATHQAAALVTTMSTPAVANPAASAAMANAAAQALRSQTQVASTLSLALQAQSAARAAAAALASTVPNGLTQGCQISAGALCGLTPVSKPVLAAADPTGLNTWQGASQPVAGASPNQVVVTQTASKAILSWTSFNIGQQTTLTFQAPANTVAQPSWVVLNRVVGRLDPLTGLRTPSLASTPTNFLGTQILGTIKAPWTVLVIDQNGILFGGTSQVNVGSLVATSLEVGQATVSTSMPLNIAARNAQFLNYGLLGYAETQGSGTVTDTFSAQAVTPVDRSATYDPMLEGTVSVAAGASLTSADGGFLMLLAPNVINAGQLSASDGEVALQSARDVRLTASAGGPGAVDPNIRGLIVAPGNIVPSTGDTVTDTGVIQSPRGYVSVGSSASGSVAIGAPPNGSTNTPAVILSTTSVSENGDVNLFGGNIALFPGAVIAIGPDLGGATLPQDAASLAGFQKSVVRIGDAGSVIDIGANSLIYAPGGNISVGADSGATFLSDLTNALTQVTVESGATIDAAGLTDTFVNFTTGATVSLEVPASRNAIKISPVLGNELANSPAFRNGFLNGATVYLDPRLSGVDANGVAWVGSPLISAAAYAQQVGVTAAQLLTTGGAVTLGTAAYSPPAAGAPATHIPSVIVKSGATIDIAGGWTTFQGGPVQQSYLVDTSGQVIPISQANPDNTNYVAVYNGYDATQPRWGLSTSYLSPLQSGAMIEGQYSQGADAGSLTIKTSSAVLDGTLMAGAYIGPEQAIGAAVGTAAGLVYGDQRKLQSAPSQLPAGGYLDIQAQGVNAASSPVGGADISIVPGSAYAPMATDPTIATPLDRLETISLNADALTQAGLSQLTVRTSGQVDVAAGAAIKLAPGGVFNAVAGGPATDQTGGPQGAITIEGSISTPSGQINLSSQALGGSVFLAQQVVSSGTYDVNVSGALDVSGRWTNDFDAAGQIVGPAYQNGGQINLSAAPRQNAGGTNAFYADAATATSAPLIDSSGSILIQPGALLNLSGGGYVSPTGALTLTAKGGNLSLQDDTTYFQVANFTSSIVTGGLPGFRTPTVVNGRLVVSVNPSSLYSHISIADGSILAQGFGGGGTFTLTTPSFAFGTSSVTGPGGGAVLPLDFFSKTGFATYNITSYGTLLTPNMLNTLGGYNAVLATQTATVGSGQTLSLNQSIFSPQVTESQIAALRQLASGGSLYSVLSPVIPSDAWDQLPVKLSLGGLIELHVAQGGSVVGAAGAGLTVSQLWNEGTIRLPGGTITQSEILPQYYATGAIAVSANGSMPGVEALSDVTLAQATADPIYVLGDLAPGVGVLLAPGSITDLSGEAIINPRGAPLGNVAPADFVDGKVVGGGSLVSIDALQNGGTLFNSSGDSIYTAGLSNATQGVSDTLIASGPGDGAGGAQINLSGAQAVFDRPSASGPSAGGVLAVTYAPTPIWSNGGSLTLDGGGAITGALVQAQGGAPLALGGTLTALDPVIYASDAAITAAGGATPASSPSTPLSTTAITAAGFASFVALGDLTSVGDTVTLTLPRSVFVESPTLPGVTDSSLLADAGVYSSVLGSGGAFGIDAPYIGLAGAFQLAPNSNPFSAAVGTNSLTLKADAIDITGAVIIDPSVANATLTATGDIRFVGVAPIVADKSGLFASTLVGQLAANGNLTLNSAQVYPTTGTTFALTSAAANGTITFNAVGATPATPYSAGGALTVLAANIVQAGVLRVPLGSLTLGSTATGLPSLTLGDPNDTAQSVALGNFAPATTMLTLAAGGTTSVSADSLAIPYGTTTDQKEYYFNPTSTSQLTAPAAAVLQLSGAQVAVNKGATVDLSGGGDVYAYEFISGTGGSRDVLNQLNSDPFTNNVINGVGYQYPDGRQIYAIVPGLSNATAAALDPIYSANYASLYGPSQVGLRVYLNAAPGLAAGWYTLLPAQYALLPGGMRVVQDTTAATPPPVHGVVQSDGTIVTTGYFGVAGVNTRSASLSVFDVQTQCGAESCNPLTLKGVQPAQGFLSESQIALTSASATFAALAASNGTPAPQLPTDAGRLILNPVSMLTLDAPFDTTPAAGGRGSQVDITGSSLYVYQAGATPAPSAASTLAFGAPIELTDTSLNNLNASSLLLGGIRTDNTDGTTDLLVSTNAIAVDTGAVLKAPEIILATNGTSAAPASLTIANGATLAATGVPANSATGAYIINGQIPGLNSSGQTAPVQVQSADGGFLRVSNGAQRAVTLMAPDPTVGPGAIEVGDATLSGASIEATTPGSLAISDGVSITATNLALGAGQIAFGSVNPTPTGAPLLITPALQAILARIPNLSLQSGQQVLFANGTYVFGNLKLDTPSITESTTGGVTFNAGVLTLANRGAAQANCIQTRNAACGADTLTVNAGQIVFDTGTVITTGFAGGVTLNATNGIFVDGAASFNAGAKTLTLNTPFLGDRGPGALAPGSTLPTPPLPSLTLATTTATRLKVSTGTIGTTVSGPVTTTIASQGGVLIATTITEGVVDVGSAPNGSTFTVAPAGTPGSDLIINAAAVSIAGTQLRATAGTLQINSASGIEIASSQLATPSYAKTFGDSADPVTVSSPGGALGLTALSGSIAISSDSTLQVGGAQGAAGSLSLVAQDGQVYAYDASSKAMPPPVVPLASVFSTGATGSTPLSGASLTLDTGGAFDLGTFATGAGRYFTGAVSVRSATGDLALGAGDTLNATSVQLVADGGAILDSGRINTSGANGGNVNLFGIMGVHLTSGSVIDAQSLGNGPTSTLQAHGGDVTLGVDGTGGILVDAGATIDVGATQTQNRLVSLANPNGAYYTFVAGDTGGTVTFSAPVAAITGPIGSETLNVTVNGGVNGASSVVLEGFHSWNLTDLVASTANPATKSYTGVSIDTATKTATLNLADVTGKTNVLADTGGPVVSFVQNFDVSADYGNLGGLASQANFHPRPGIQLDYSGNIVLASNWNLGAGVVNQTAAIAAGILTPDPSLPGRYVVTPGDEGQLLGGSYTAANGKSAYYTNAIYRVGGTFVTSQPGNGQFYGEPGLLSIRAGGNLTLNGSVTDGFFQFGDQTASGYLSYVIGGGNRTYQGSFQPGCFTGVCQGVGDYAAASSLPTNYVDIAFPNASSLIAVQSSDGPSPPYSAAANSPAAVGSLPGGTGDPLGSAQLFPLLPTASGLSQVINSWSYNFVAGADLTGAGGQPSVNPLTVVQGANAAFTLAGAHVYGYTATKGAVSFLPTLDLQDTSGVNLAAADWYSAFTSQTNLDPNAFTVVDYSSFPHPAVFSALLTKFFQMNPTYVHNTVAPDMIAMPLSVANQFLIYVSSPAQFAAIAKDYTPPGEVLTVAGPIYATAPSLVRTGTGSIDVAAAGNIDLRNGASPTVIGANGTLVTATLTHLGGTAIYTAGHVADLGCSLALNTCPTATDPATGLVFTVDLSANTIYPDYVTANSNGQYQYGAGYSQYGIPSRLAGAESYAGILVTNPVYAEGGGAVSLDAGLDVLSRRNTLLEGLLGGVGLDPVKTQTFGWIGSGDQPWRTGVIGGLGSTVYAQLNPQLFNEGVGTLAGGDISVHAGRDISDLSLVANDSLTTAGIGGGPDSGALVMLGGGNITATAGRNILGGRLDLAAGVADLTAGGSVMSAGMINEHPTFYLFGLVTTPTPNTLRAQISDGTVDIHSGGAAQLQGVAALGVASGDANSAGFYSAGSGVSILANGPVTIANTGFDLLTTSQNTTYPLAVYPGSLSAASLTASLDPSSSGVQMVLYPDPTGTLTLLAGGDIAPATIAQLDSIPSLSPGAFTSFTFDSASSQMTGLAFLFPSVLPNDSDFLRREQHNPDITHAGDSTPNRIAAGGDITDASLSVAKQTRISAGRDIVNMVFVGQNVAASDVTRITAGRDITATTALQSALVSVNARQLQYGPLLPTVQGDTFLLGGPGALFIETGRNAGPFLNSAVTNGFQQDLTGTPVSTGALTYGGGIITEGNLLDPWLPAQSANIFTEFGIAKGENFQGLIGAYLDPSNLSSLQAYEFLQTTGAGGVQTPDRSKPIYGLSLVDWITSIAPDIVHRYDISAGVAAPGANAPALVLFAQSLTKGTTPTFAQVLTYLPQLTNQTLPLIPWLLLNQGAAVQAAYGTQDITYQQAYNLFLTLPQLSQREFLLKDVYFNELIQTSVPTSPSFLQYSRGYIAVNTLFPSSDGYTQNSLSGGPGGASTTVQTGDLDLRLSTIQTAQGGDVLILGPGGRVLAGSTVATSVQASRRNYAGGALYSGYAANLASVSGEPYVSAIASIPPSYEGVLTLAGGDIYAFTDGNFLLNQSRAFAEQGGDIAIWSSNGNVNAGQGPRTTADMPPVVVRIDENGFSTVNSAGAVSGAGIGAFQPDDTALAPAVYLMAPRGTVDAGAAGVRSSGDIFIAAFQVANAAGFQTSKGVVTGDQTPGAVNVSAQSSGQGATAAAAQAAQSAANATAAPSQRPLIYVDVLGFLAGESDTCSDDDRKRGRCY